MSSSLGTFPGRLQSRNSSLSTMIIPRPGHPCNGVMERRQPRPSPILSNVFHGCMSGSDNARDSSRYLHTTVLWPAFPGFVGCR